MTRGMHGMEVIRRVAVTHPPGAWRESRRRAGRSTTAGSTRSHVAMVVEGRCITSRGNDQSRPPHCFRVSLLPLTCASRSRADSPPLCTPFASYARTPSSRLPTLNIQCQSSTSAATEPCSARGPAKLCVCLTRCQLHHVSSSDYRTLYTRTMQQYHRRSHSPRLISVSHRILHIPSSRAHACTSPGKAPFRSSAGRETCQTDSGVTSM